MVDPDAALSIQKPMLDDDSPFPSRKSAERHRPVPASPDRASPASPEPASPKFQSRFANRSNRAEPSSKAEASSKAEPSSRSERRLSRKPAPTVVQVFPDQPESSGSGLLHSKSTTTLRTNGSTDSGPRSPTSPRDDRERITVNGQAWEVIPVPAHLTDVEEDGRGMHRSTSRVAMINVADIFGSAPPRKRTQSRPERPVNGQDRERERSDAASIFSSQAPAPPPKSPERPPRREKTSDKPPALPSKSGMRPTSEVYSDGNGLRAREAYSLERLHKGMTVHSGVAGVPNGVPSVKGSTRSSRDSWDRDLPPVPAQSRESSSGEASSARRQPSMGSGHTNFAMSPVIASRPTY